MWKKLSNGASIVLSFMLLLSAVVVTLPGMASAFDWTEDTDTDFDQGTFTNTERIGTGTGATVQLKKDIFSWIQEGPPPDPGEKEGPGYCFDEVGGVMVTFGGYKSGVYTNETWEYDYAANSWTQITTPTAPAGRGWPGMAYDSTNEVCVLFGGLQSGPVLKDTWEYDVNTNTWLETSPFFGPMEMFSSPLAFDTNAQKTILVGQDFASGNMETWAYDASLDSWTGPWGGGITDRAGHAMAYDASRDRTVVFGGSVGMTLLGDTWEFNYATKGWQNFGATGPSPRYSHAMAYNSDEGAVYLFAGTDAVTRFQDTWKRVGTIWSLVNVLGSPPGRDSPALVYDNVNGYLIMCCGWSGSLRFNDTWVLGASYQPMGFYLSRVYDTGNANVNYTAIYMNQSVGSFPPLAELRIRLATSVNPGGPFSFVGPDGSVGSWYSNASEAIPDFHDHERYIQYNVDFLTFDGKYSPVLDNVAISYTIDDAPPYLSETSPANSDLNVPTDTCIYLNFSEPMKTLSVSYQIYYLNPKETTGIVFTETWLSNDTTLRLCPQTPFLESKAVQVWVNGTDMDDLPLDPGQGVPNPFVFVTAGFPPYILTTDPIHQESGVPIDADIVVTWSEPMDTSSVTFQMNAGTDPFGWSQSWTVGDSVLTLSHNPFTECDDIEFEILTAMDKGGKDFEPLMGSPNPWQFKVACLSPYVVNIIPHDGMGNVATNQPIIVEFSEPMAIGTLSHDIDPTVSLSPTWSNFNQDLTVNHGLFSEGETYTYCINYVEDVEGYPLLDLPYCVVFTTISNNPYIIVTVPADGDVDVDPSTTIVVGFSEAMNTGSVLWTLTPNIPDKATWTDVWNDPLNEMLQLLHVQPMAYCAQYTFEITAGTDPSGYPLIPGPVPNPWSFNTTCENPVVVTSSPLHDASGVPLWEEISITFSEPIDKATFSFSVSPLTGGTVWTETWSNGDMTVTLNHSEPLQPNSRITVDVTSANDLDGNPLMPGPYPNPFGFWTMADPNWPWIESTAPFNGETFVLTDESIVVVFSETMDTATVTWDIQDMSGPSPIVFTPTWSQTSYPDDTLTLSHVTPFNECDTIFVLIAGYDLDGNPLQNGPVPNPWSFETICVLPAIMTTDPPDGDVNVPLYKEIVIDFSEEMQPATLQWNINPDPGGWTQTWSNNNWTVTLNHTTDFVQCTIHDIQVTQAWDLDNNNIIPGPAPNPWSFTTACINPYIVSTDPYDGEVNVPQDYNVTIVFSEPMDTPTVVFQIQPSLPFNYVWSGGDTVLTITHTDPFIECQLYDAGISDGLDLEGYPLIPGPSPVPNPWTFTTECVNPWVVSTDPPDAAIDVLLNAGLIIDFSEPMETLTVSINVDPNPGNWSAKEWGNNDATMWWNHTNDFSTCTTITVTIQSGQDKVGLDLQPIPYIWDFQTECPNPTIIWTDPFDGETNVELNRDIQVEFNDPMDTATVFWSISSPDPGGWAENWYSGDTLLVLTHNDFEYLTIYTFCITDGYDKDGYQLMPTPPTCWQFRTMDFPVGPNVNWTDPAHLESNVALTQDIIISFTKEIVPATFHWNFTLGPDPGGWSEAWSQMTYPSDTVTLRHSNPFIELTSYCIRVEHARDTFGQDLESGPVEFCFSTTSTLPPPGGLTVTKFGVVVRVTWNVVIGATHYNVYDSTDRFAAFPGAWNMNQVADPTNVYDFGHLGDGLNHYYIVTAYDSGATQESAPSTMGVKIHKTFTTNPMTANIFWMSLPYISEYTTAGDITTELTDTNINLVAKWDRASQEVVSYYYARGKWRGRDFAIGPGDGIYVSAVTDFNWVIVGTDSDASVDLPYSPQAFKTNKHYMSVPYTGVYTHASDIVVDIEGGLGVGRNTYIIEVGLWDPATQSERVYSYTPSGWAGDNFVISPGDGVYLRMVQGYVWQPVLVTPYVP